MVYSKDNSVIVTCGCGCDNVMTIRVIDDNVFISFSKSAFYIYQCNFMTALVSKIKGLVSNIANKAHCVEELVLSEEETKDFLQSIDAILVKPNGPKGENSGVLEFCTSDLKEYGVVWLSLISKADIYDICRGRTYKDYDIVFNKEQWEGFKKYVHRKLEEVSE